MDNAIDQHGESIQENVLYISGQRVYYFKFHPHLNKYSAISLETSDTYLFRLPHHWIALERIIFD